MSLVYRNWGVQKNNYIRTGVSQVLARMNYGSTLSHLRRCVIPIGKEGKNAKIRQTHPSQIMYLCPNECFDPNTPILLWNGAIKMAKDIIVGDYLIDDNGNPTRVRTTCSGFTTMYEVQQEKNNFMNYTVTDNHILTLKIRLFKQLTKHNNRPKKYNLRWFNKETLKDNYKDFSSLEEAIEFNNSIKEDDILDITIEKYLKLPENIRKRLVGFKCNNVNWEEDQVNFYELLEFINYERHIPENFILNSRINRLKVLAIIIDKWGSVRANGHEIRIDIQSSMKSVIRDIVFTSRSLGFSCTQRISRYNRKNSPCQEITITGEFIYEIPSKKYKINSHIDNEIARKRSASFLQSPIQVVKKEFAPFVGWQLEGNGRFLLSDFTVVHNTPKFIGRVIPKVLLVCYNRQHNQIAGKSC